MALVCEAESLVFSGDIVVNISGFTREQAAFNRLAPYLMTSVNMDSRRASQERDALTERFSPGAYIYCCGHGAIWDRRGALPAQIEISNERGAPLLFLRAMRKSSPSMRPDAEIRQKFLHLHEFFSHISKTSL